MQKWQAISKVRKLPKHAHKERGSSKMTSDPTSPIPKIVEDDTIIDVLHHETNAEYSRSTKKVLNKHFRSTGKKH